ncbi:MAG: hypothetical protein DI537_17400 [Stutzerimonas stutzeri]|nr:MAG: hypothetical protein DI537_17400 [Stutzerimonas stutzeri]
MPPRSLWWLLSLTWPLLTVAAAAQDAGQSDIPSRFVPMALLPLAGDQDAPVISVRTAKSVSYESPRPVGTIVISTSKRVLHLITADGNAVRYRVAVGKGDFAWTGEEKVTRKAMWPDWRPPADMRKRRPDLPKLVTGGPDNPLGARALYLGDTLYRIHGSNEPGTIGHAVSSGCIRLSNEDIIDLYDRVPIGATVIVEP